MTIELTIRPTSQAGGIIPGLFPRKGIEVINDSGLPIRDLVVAGLGQPFTGTVILGSPIPLLEPGEAAPYLFERPPFRAAEWIFRVSGELPDGTLFAVNLSYKPRR